MTRIEEAYQFALQVEEMFKKSLMEGKEGTVKEKGAVVGHLEAKTRTRRKMNMWVPTKTRGTRVSTTPMIKNLEIREEKVEDVEQVQEEEASLVPIFIAMNKVIMPSNSLNDKEGQIGELI